MKKLDCFGRFWTSNYLHGVQGVEGSNPFTPTRNFIEINGLQFWTVARFFSGLQFQI